MKNYDITQRGYVHLVSAGLALIGMFRLRRHLAMLDFDSAQHDRITGLAKGKPTSWTAKDAKKSREGH